MSSPIAKDHKTKLDHTLIKAHKKISHNRRIAILAQEFSDRIQKISQSQDIASPAILDVGCGDMTLAEAVAEILETSTIKCADIHPCSEELREQDSRWNKYTQFDGKNLPFGDKSFDFLIFSDVLHHVPEEVRKDLLTSAARVAKWIIIKDHFEYGWVSRQALRSMDWIGNYGYGISIPQRYLDRKSLLKLLESAGLQASTLDIGVELYNHLPIINRLLNARWQFFATCENTL